MSPSDNIKDHVEKMHKCYEGLDAIITPEKPLTADDIYATSLLISLPPDWTSCISHLLQSDSTTSSVIVRALKQESTRRKSKLINSSEDATASRSNISKDNKSPDQSFCSFCNKDGHDLDTCQTASRILKEAKEAYA